MTGEELGGDEHDARAAVGDLTAVEAPDPALNEWVRRRVAAGPELGHGPAAGLRVRVAPGVAEVDLGDPGQVRQVDAVAPVVLVEHLVEHVGPHEGRVLALVADPRGRAEVPGGLVAADRLLQFEAEDERGVVVARPQVGHGRERGDAAGGAGGLVPGGGHAPQSLVDGGRHRAEVPLAREQLAEGVADVDHADLLRVDASGRECPLDHLRGQVGEVLALAMQVPGEVRLVAAEHPHVRLSHPTQLPSTLATAALTTLQLTEKPGKGRSMDGWGDQVAIVTGGGKGLGRAFALDLARRGVRVVVNNRNREVDADGRGPADHVAAEILAAGGTAVAHHGAVEDPESAESMVRLALSEWGRLDILITSAGISGPQMFHKTTQDNFRQVLDVNVLGTVLVASAAARVMRAAGHGRILMVSSTAGLFGEPTVSAYAASKGAVIALAKTAAVEGAARGVYTNALLPYATTQMTAHGMDQR